VRRGLGSGGCDGPGIAWQVGGLDAELDADLEELEDDLLDADELEDTELNDDDPLAPFADDDEAA
jgi:hypothetical protein